MIQEVVFGTKEACVISGAIVALELVWMGVGEMRLMSVDDIPSHAPALVFHSAVDAGIPPGCGSLRVFVSGGVASLNHRLMAVIPPGCGLLQDSIRWRKLHLNVGPISPGRRIVSHMRHLCSTGGFVHPLASDPAGIPLVSGCPSRRQCSRYPSRRLGSD